MKKKNSNKSLYYILLYNYTLFVSDNERCVYINIYIKNKKINIIIRVCEQ